MDQTKTAIANRSNLKMTVYVDTPSQPKGLVFIAHGLGGFAKQVHIEAFAQSFLANNYRVVRFDATHALGESEGELAEVTYDTYISDLEDVIAWAKQQDWFTSPFALCGHSMGAQSTTWYAEHNPDDISLLLPMAPTVNYELHSTTMPAEFLKQWQQEGYKEMMSRSMPGVMKRMNWTVQESLKKFDILPLAGNLIMPVLMIVGSQDNPSPPKHQQIFMNLVGSNNKQLTILDGLEHSYRNDVTNLYDEGIENVQAIITTWLKDLK